MISQGDVVWADLPEPVGSEPGFRRPVVVVQGDQINRTAFRTVVCVPLTTNMRWAAAHGNAALKKAETGLEEDSVAMCANILTVDKSFLGPRVGRLPRTSVDVLIKGVLLVLGR